MDTARITPGIFAALVLLYLATAADNLVTTLRLAAASGLGRVGERNPLAVLAWGRYGAAGLVGLKVAAALLVTLAALALYRLGARRVAVAGLVLAVLAAVAVAGVEAWQFVHLPGYLPPAFGG